MTPLKVEIRNKRTGEVVRWGLDCYKQKATIRQLNSDLTTFPKKLTSNNSTVIAEALVIDRKVDGVLFRGIHAAEWTNDFVIWSDIKNPSIIQVLMEYVHIEYNHLTKMGKGGYDVTYLNSPKLNSVGCGKTSAVAITLENLKERKSEFTFIKDTAKGGGKTCSSASNSTTEIENTLSSNKKLEIPKVVVTAKGVKYTNGQLLTCIVQNRKTYSVLLKVGKCDIGGSVLEIDIHDKNRDYSFLREPHQITKIQNTKTKPKSKSRLRSHGLRVEFQFEEIEKPVTDTVGEIISNGIADEVGNLSTSSCECESGLGVDENPPSLIKKLDEAKPKEIKQDLLEVTPIVPSIKNGLISDYVSLGGFEDKETACTLASILLDLGYNVKREVFFGELSVTGETVYYVKAWKD